MPERSGLSEKRSEDSGTDVASWYDHYHLRLLKYLRGSLRTESDAQDVSQEVFLRLLRVPEDRVIKHPRAYLFRVAANVLNDWWAGEKAFDARAAEDPDQIPAPDNCDEDYDQRQQKERIRQAISSLPTHYRATLLLKAQHGMSYQEIASHLQVSERMVKRYIVKAYARLREQLSALEHSDQ
ncbi:MAG: sigma-70 family RNA polymerase sigma factor [Woeseia sp.]